MVGGTAIKMLVRFFHSILAFKTKHNNFLQTTKCWHFPFILLFFVVSTWADSEADSNPAETLRRRGKICKFCVSKDPSRN